MKTLKRGLDRFDAFEWQRCDRVQWLHGSGQIVENWKIVGKMWLGVVKSTSKKDTHQPTSSWMCFALDVAAFVRLCASVSSWAENPLTWAQNVVWFLNPLAHRKYAYVFRPCGAQLYISIPISVFLVAAFTLLHLLQNQRERTHKNQYLRVQMYLFGPWMFAVCTIPSLFSSSMHKACFKMRNAAQIYPGKCDVAKLRWSKASKSLVKQLYKMT